MTAKRGMVSGVGTQLKRIFYLFAFVLMFLFGGFCFNLDRLGDFGIRLLEYKHFLPSQIRRLLPGESAPYGTAAPQQRLSGRILEVYDGDTATLYADNRRYKIRFYGIDAPEAAQEHGIASRNLLRERILNRNVQVNAVNVDPYGRVVGKVYLDSRYINREMVEEGGAWHYAAYAKKDYDLAAAQYEARRWKRGLWAADSPRPPWDYRHSREK